MFGFAWSEIALIAAVALVFIGPKDMPVAMRAVAAMVKKARRMAAEFQGHVDEMIREADLGEVRDQFNAMRRMDLRDHLQRNVDGDGAIRNTLRDDPFGAGGRPIAPTAPSAPAELPPLPVQAVDIRPAHEVSLPPDHPPASTAPAPTPDGAG